MRPLELHVADRYINVQLMLNIKLFLSFSLTTIWRSAFATAGRRPLSARANGHAIA